MKFHGANVVQLLLINSECVGGLQFNNQNKHFLKKSMISILPTQPAKIWGADIKFIHSSHCVSVA